MPSEAKITIDGMTLKQVKSVRSYLTKARDYTQDDVNGGYDDDTGTLQKEIVELTTLIGLLRTAKKIKKA